MKAYLYLSLIPEALIASHLPPEEYGVYLAVGARRRSRGQAIFFRLSDAYAESRFRDLKVPADLERTERSTPRRSCYLSVYRVLEQTPLSALESLHLVTDDGRVLTLHPADFLPAPKTAFHLYQEFCPATPRIVSLLDPRAFARHITDSRQRVSLPAVVFADLRLADLSQNPDAAGVDDLPYPNIEHLRDCLRELRDKPGKPAKTVIRFLQQDVLFRTLHRGFYVAASGDGFRFFPMPSLEKLETIFDPWWRSALSDFGG